ncbi:hypothetical protein ACERK3_17090 [Phycisphaerales bacterium AB-hyl4]|uniref:Uncharacterized protein n=1 Tax=Natronomicrosphaera hydrolytica TaxID=3242702 RepID=A0ABV4UAT6_9BACT
MKQHTIRSYGFRLLVTAWCVGAIVMVLPAYHGEVISPGAVMTIVGLQIALFGFIFGFMQPELLLMATIPITLFALSPLMLLRRLNKQYVLPALWGGLLIFSAASPIIAAFEPMYGVNERLFGFYLLPLPLVIAGLALCLLSYAGKLNRREAYLRSVGRCANCAYNLQGNPDAPCPECGHTSQADDA